jgi:hypothetical protein
MGETTDDCARIEWVGKIIADVSMCNTDCRKATKNMMQDISSKISML